MNRATGSGVAQLLVHILAVCGWGLYLWAWFLPALATHDGEDSGAAAFTVALMATFMVLHGFVFVLPAALACVGNLLVFVSVCAYLSPNANGLFRSTPRMLLAITPFNILSGYMLPDGFTGRASGFWMWVTSYLVAAAAIALRRLLLRTPGSPRSRVTSVPGRGGMVRSSTSY